MARQSSQSRKPRTSRWMAAILAVGIALGAVAPAEAGDRPSRAAGKGAVRSRTTQKRQAAQRAGQRASSDKSKARSSRTQSRSQRERSDSRGRRTKSGAVPIGTRTASPKPQVRRVSNPASKLDRARAFSPRKALGGRSIRDRIAPVEMKAPRDKTTADRGLRGHKWNGADDLKYGFQVRGPRGGLGTETLPEGNPHEGRDPAKESAKAKESRVSSRFAVGGDSDATDSWVDQVRDTAENGPNQTIESDLGAGAGVAGLDNGGPLGDLPDFAMPENPDLTGQDTKPDLGNGNPLAPEGNQGGDVPDSGKYVGDKNGEEAPTDAGGSTEPPPTDAGGSTEPPPTDAGGSTEPPSTMAERKSLWTRFVNFVIDWSVGVGTDPVPVPAGTALGGAALIESVTGDAADLPRGVKGNRRLGETGSSNENEEGQLSAAEAELKCQRTPGCVRDQAEGHVDPAWARASLAKFEAATHYMAIKIAARKGSRVNPLDDTESAASGPPISSADIKQWVKDLTVRGGTRAAGAMSAADIAKRAKLQSSKSGNGLGVINPGSGFGPGK